MRDRRDRERSRHWRRHLRAHGLRGRLSARIYMHFLGVLVVVGVASSVVFATGWRFTFLRGFTQRMVRHAASVVGQLPEAGEREHMVRYLAEDLDLEITLRDPSGRLLVAAGAELPPLDPRTIAQAHAGPSLVQEGPRFYGLAPVRAPDGALIGILQVIPTRRFAPAALLRPLELVGAVLLVVALAMAPLARRISRPVERLTEASRRLGSGDLSYRVPLGLDHHDFERLRQRLYRFGARVGRRFDARLRRAAERHRPPDELEQLTAAWNEMAERIERQVRGQRELLANVSHELRSPLARIRVALALLPENDETRGRVADLESDLGELEQLIDDVLTTSRLDFTGLPTHLERVALGPLFEQLSERARVDPATSGKELRVSLGGPERAPDGAGDGAGELEADGALLKRALWNLIENAAKYGAPPITLAATRSADGAAVELSVSDQGDGIAPEDRARVFDPFYRADRARTPGAGREGARGGFGLGLTLARRIAEVHGGSIRLEPAPNGRGCTITLSLPARDRA